MKIKAEDYWYIVPYLLTFSMMDDLNDILSSEDFFFKNELSINSFRNILSIKQFESRSGLSFLKPADQDPHCQAFSKVTDSMSNYDIEYNFF